MSSGTLIAVVVSSAAGRVNDCLWADTKIGALPPGTDGKLGIGNEGISVVVLSSFFFAFFSLNFSNLFLCNSFSLALNGLGLLSLKGLMTTLGAESVVSVGVTEMVELLITDVGLMLDENPPELWKGEPLENLLPPLLNRLALPTNRELFSKMGVFSMAELAGVAISVGFTLFLVLVATVVLTLRLLGLKIRAGFLLPSSGRMTGVNVFPGRDMDARTLVLDGRTILLLTIPPFLPSSSLSVVTSPSVVLPVVNVKSSSSLSKSCAVVDENTDPNTCSASRLFSIVVSSSFSLD